MQFFHNSSNRPVVASNSQTLGYLKPPAVTLPRGVIVLCEELEKAAQPMAFDRALVEVYDKSAVRVLKLPGEKDPFVRTGTEEVQDLSDYLSIITSTFHQVLKASVLQPEDLSERFRKRFNFREAHHRLAELAGVSIDFSMRLRRNGYFDIASEIMHQAYQLAYRFRDPFLRASSSFEIGMLERSFGNYAEAVGQFRQLFQELAPSIATDGRTKCWALPRIPEVVRHLRERLHATADPHVRDVVRDAFEVLRVISADRYVMVHAPRSDVTSAYLSVAAAAMEIGRFDESRLHCTTAFNIAENARSPEILCETSISGADILSRIGEIPKAVESLVRAALLVESYFEKIRPERQHVEKLGGVLDKLIEIHIEQGHAGQVAAVYDQKANLYRRYGLDLPNEGNEPDPAMA